MYAVNFTLKSGKKIDALIWTFVPEEGWFKALDESNGKVKQYKFSDIRSGVVYPDHIRMEYHDTQDFLKWAMQEGWQP